VPTPRSSPDHAPVTLQRSEPLNPELVLELEVMAAVGVDNDASVVHECENGKLPVRLSTLASKAHVDSTCCGLRPAPDACADTTKSAETRYSMVCCTT
jgi:hypothetical protein